MKVYRFPCGCEFPILEESADPSVLPLLDFNSDDVPESCPATWALLGRGDTKGIFQLESNLGRQWTKKLKPESLEHMGALGALLRPGPLKGVDAEGVSMTEHYVRRKNGEEEVTSFHPRLDPLLGKTYNVLVFQEQMMFIARDIAGFDLVGMDKLRKAVGKKDQQALAKVRDEFLEGAKRLALVTEEQAATIWSWIAAAGRYAFNKAHADSYGMRGYKTAYIKAHFPVAFFVSWLKNSKYKSDPQQEVAELVNDARLFDIDIEPPDIRSPEADVHSDRKVVKFGIANIKGIGESQAAKIAASIRELEMELGRPVARWTWADCLLRLSGRMTSTAFGRCVQAGALRHLPVGRRRMLAEYEAWASLTEKEQEWVRERVGQEEAFDLAKALHALALPAYRKPADLVEEVVTPRKGKEARAAELEAEYERLCRDMGERMNAEEVGEETDSDFVQSLIDANRAEYGKVTKTVRKKTPAPEPVGPFGGCSSPRRAEVVESQAMLLDNPPSSLSDNPHWVAWSEETLIGVALSCSKIDACDVAEVNCSCKEYLAGRTGYTVLGVEVQAVREVKTKKGKSVGSKMAFLTLADGSCALTDVVCFPDVWKEYGGLLTEGNTVIVQGERDGRPKEKDSTTFVVKKAWQAVQGGGSIV